MTTRSVIVAVVESEFSMRRALERLLRASGYESVSFPTAEAYLSRDYRLNVGCLILDINLCGISGLELQMRLARHGDAPPIIFITNQSDERSRACAAKFGYVAYLETPLESGLLIDAIDTALCTEREAR